MKTIEEVFEKLQEELSYAEYSVSLETTDETQLISVCKGNQLWCLLAPLAYSATQKNRDLLKSVKGNTDYIYWIFSADNGYEVINRKILVDDRLPANPYRRYQIAKTVIKEKDLSSFLQHEPKTLNEIILDVFNKAVDDYKYKGNSLRFIVQGITNDKIHCQDGIVSIDEQIEEKLFKNLIGEYTEPDVCRYTSLGSLYYTLTNHTFRLNGLAGMNDKGERNFLQNAIYQNDIALVYKEWLKSNKDVEPDERFIMSCTSIKKFDHLEMWRLYAEDAQGVCLVFGKKTLNEEFVLAPIRYDRCSDVKDDWMPQFKFIADVAQGLGEKGLLFIFHKFEDWKIFVKSGEYNYEKEVRLVYKPKDSTTHKAKQWVLTTSNYIINPYVEFALTEAKATNDGLLMFPLKLKKIILGPKCPEAEVNKEQIKRLLSLDPELRKMDIDVEISEIHNYR